MQLQLQDMQGLKCRHLCRRKATLQVQVQAEELVQARAQVQAEAQAHT